jgi:Na+/melibiose symporter-like transporter
MTTNFPLLFCVALIVNVTVTTVSSDWYKQYRRSQLQNGGSSTGTNSETQLSADEIDTKKRWHTLLRKYLIVYLLATMSDWLQGPYVYALYDNYNYSQHDIAVLFVAGFGSSMIFGSFIGGMADWGGRRTFVILFSIIYAASCFTKRTFFMYVCVCVCVCDLYLC